MATARQNGSFRWVDRAGAVSFASAEFRRARDSFDEPISVAVACGRAIGYAGGPMAGRFCSTTHLGDRRWEKFRADVRRDISRMDEIGRFLADDRDDIRTQPD